jgi:polyisoprenoid-binding protein YceI
MKGHILLALLTIIFLTSATQKSAMLYRLDPSRSTFKWTGKEVTGSHWGYVRFTEGELMVENNILRGGTFEVDMHSMDCQDAGEKLLNHLKSDDFFSVAKFPTAILVIKKAVFSGGDQYGIKADLTIKGITHEVLFPATVMVSDHEMYAQARFSVDRTKYNIKYRSAGFFSNLGDKAIDDHFEVDVNIVAGLDYSKAMARRSPSLRSTRGK